MHIFLGVSVALSSLYCASMHIFSGISVILFNLCSDFMHIFLGVLVALSNLCSTFMHLLSDSASTINKTIASKLSTSLPLLPTLPSSISKLLSFTFTALSLRRSVRRILSIQNWVEDLYWKQLDINYPGIADAMVHHGFYFAYHNTTVRSGVLNAVNRAKKLYGNLKVMVTGHSMGGAMASFCGLDLTLNDEAQDIQVMTFGQPRIGNAAFASYYSQVVPNMIRVTHEHDIVPHLPPYYYYFPQKTYHHFPREVWLYNIGLGSLVYTVEKVCDGSGEDPSCSRSVSGNSIVDHLVYYGVALGGEPVGTCRIVMDPRVAAYSTKDLRGNIILSRNPSASVLKLNTEPGL